MTWSEIAEAEVPLEIHIAVDDKKKTFTIQVGLVYSDLVWNDIRSVDDRVGNNRARSAARDTHGCG